MSDSGAIPGPTVTTVPVRPRRARASRLGVSAASSGVRPSSSGMGSSPSPSRQTYRRLVTGSSPRRCGQRNFTISAKLLRVEARAADERTVDLRVRHELADVAGLHAPSVLHPDPLGDRVVVLRGQGARGSSRPRARRPPARRCGPCRSPRWARRRPRRPSPPSASTPSKARRTCWVTLDSVPSASRSSRVSPTHTIGAHAVREDRLHLLVHESVVLAEELAPLRVAHDHVVDLQRLEHGRRDLAGERALVLEDRRSGRRGGTGACPSPGASRRRAAR